MAAEIEVKLVGRGARRVVRVGVRARIEAVSNESEFNRRTKGARTMTSCHTSLPTTERAAMTT
jgi:hypothetical protein